MSTTESVLVCCVVGLVAFSLLWGVLVAGMIDNLSRRVHDLECRTKGEACPASTLTVSIVDGPKFTVPTGARP